MKPDVLKVYRVKFASRSFRVMGPWLWNEMPNNLKQCISIESFQKSLKTFLYDKF